MVSPGTTPVALTERRFVDAPVAPKAIVTVPDVTDCDADVVEVNDANVPSEAMPAAAPTAPSLKSSLRAGVRSSDFIMYSWRLERRVQLRHRSQESEAG